MNNMKDPVCGMRVTKASDFYAAYKDQKFYFCSENCMDKFTQNPVKYSGKDRCGHCVAEQPSDPTPKRDSVTESAEIYTCPMHPEIEQIGPGSCPKCGMALEPKGVPVKSTKTQYTCPMHPEIIRDEPGNCPICGMALEPTTVDVDEDNHELKDMRRRFFVSAILSVPVFILAMITDVVPDWLPDSISLSLSQWIQFVLATPVVL